MYQASPAVFWSLLGSLLEQFTVLLFFITVEAGTGCQRFGRFACPPHTIYDFSWCVCNHKFLVDEVTCRSIPVTKRQPPAAARP